jgi:cyclophilin family peptidyl-prolyl cis-trans isomerase
MVNNEKGLRMKWVAMICCLVFGACAAQQKGVELPLLLSPESPALHEKSPEVYRVKMETTKGDVVIEVHRDWSPHGADRFYNLVRAGYYDHCKFFRVMPRWAQFGVNGDPAISKMWRERTIPDDPRVVSNSRGTVAFAFAVPNGRTTQLFINRTENAATHDGEFVPFGKVVEGMAAVDALNGEYGERSGGGIRAGKQQKMFDEGNAWLEREFPRLDEIKRAVVVGGAPAGARDGAKTRSHDTAGKTRPPRASMPAKG